MFDHLARKAFACRSNRTDEDLLGRVCKEVGGYEPVVFTSRDKNGQVRDDDDESNLFAIDPVYTMVACGSA